LFNSIKNTFIKSFKTSRQFLLSCFWLALILIAGFYALESRTVLSQTFYSCSSLQSGTANTPDDDNPGLNCHYLGLPPCKTFVGNKQPRVNCADLIDLPLCSTITPTSNVASGVNCAKLASEISPVIEKLSVKVRGVDYAVNNKDSIRICGTQETCDNLAGERCNLAQMNDSNNCIKFKCHQKTASETPDKSSNCDIIDCKLLTLEELMFEQNRFSDDSKQYCEGNSKCYDFFNNAITGDATTTKNSDNLKYIVYRPNNPLCQIHNCKPDSASCGADDTIFFDSTNAAYKGDTYREDYAQYINAGMPIEGGLCKPLNCKTIASRHYGCNFFDCSQVVNADKPECVNLDSPPSNPNSNCDCSIECPTCPAANGCPAGFTRECASGGYCNKKIDCNIAANNSQPECVVSNPESEDTDSDLFNAWFYRPTPPSSIVDNSSHLVRSDVKERINKDSDSSTPGIQPKLCYSAHRINHDSNDLRYLDWGTYIDLGLLGEYYYHTTLMSARSPGICEASNDGDRGLGYGYLCDNGLNIFKNPRSDVGFIKGVANVNYELPNPEYRIKACLRYANYMHVSGCGKRDCLLTVLNSSGTTVNTQFCGRDVCKEMKISAEDTNRCSLEQNGGLFDRSDESHPCISKTIDMYVRMRVKKYGRMLCVFVDHKGAVAYDNKNFKGDETITDKSLCNNNEPKVNGSCPNGFKTFCVGGDRDEYGKCQGKNTNDDRGLATKWRTVKRIQYIGDNRGGNKPGYVDMNEQFFAEQDCAKIPLRIGPPRFYNVATIANTRTLFEPPLFVLNVRTARGGAISDPFLGQQFGATDFYQPEIVVQYGSEQKKMSLGNGYLGKDGVQENYPLSPWEKTITTSINGLQHSAEAYVQKEYSANLSQPLLCLYRRAFDQFGAPTDPIKLTCVNRSKPELRDDTTIPSKMRLLITPDAGNIFNSAKLKLQLISDYGANNQNNSCTGDDVCSQELIFENINADTESCSSNIERYKFCSKRDGCSKLLYECVDNDIAINNALASGQPTGVFEAIKENCNTTILSNCNGKFGINDSDSPDFLSQISSTAVADMNYQNFPSLFNDTTKAKVDPKAYGWFNEICIVKGFEDKLKKIIANKSTNGVLGKCQIDISKSLYLNDGISATNCNAGGKAPYCVCSEFIEGFTLLENQESRLETPREAGLCIDIPLPNFCSAIDHTATGSLDDYIASSITNSHSNPSYNNGTGVNTSHQLRTLNTPDYHHAEYNSILGGSNNVAGVCKGFWKLQTNSHGETLLPKLDCKINGQWEKVDGNDCERYSCPEIYTEFSNSTNAYINHYADTDTSGNEGLSHGYALWHKLTKTTDFLGTYASAYQCITGFKVNASSQLPKRHCNQVGTWEPIASNPCERITCPAQSAGDGTLPTSITTQSQMDAWVANGGAEFTTTNASRSNAAITSRSTAYGTCKNTLGFFKLKSSSSPSRTCDHLGNWSTTVTNPCATLDCNDIDAPDARDTNNGFALWPKTTNVPATIGGFRDVKATSCLLKGTLADPAIDWVPNPYAPIDPATGQSTLPTRHCSSVETSNGWATVWNTPVNSCIDKCPGADVDPTHGVTSEKISNGMTDIRWGSAAFGQYSYFDGPCINMNASLFTQERTNGCYRLRRLCGNGSNGFKKGEWGTVEPMCVSNGGRNGNATYFADSDSTTKGSADSMAVNGSTSTGTCSPTYWKVNLDSGEAPVRQCLYKDGIQNIDQVYLALVSGTQDCVKKTCSVTDGQLFGNPAYSRYLGVNRTDIALNSTINLTNVNQKCKDNSEQATATCAIDENGNPTLGNLANPFTRDCRSCDNTSKDITSVSTDGCGCTVDYMFDRLKTSNKTMWPLTHDLEMNGNGQYGCSTRWRMNFQCKDGTLKVNTLHCP
jgi:hypothetical protein